MSWEQLERTGMNLPHEKGRQFARWFCEHENEIVEPRDDDEISPAVRAEILRRRDEALARPERMEPWVGTMDRVKARLDEYVVKKLPPATRASTAWKARNTS